MGIEFTSFMLTLLHLFVTSLVPLSPHQKKGHISSLNFLIFVAFMNYVDVSLQIKCIPQCSHFWFLGCCLHQLHRCFFKLPAWENYFPQESRFALVIFVSFMNCVHVFLQSSCLRKWFTTNFTFVIFWPSWTVWMCLFKVRATENDLPQDSHV